MARVRSRKRKSKSKRLSNLFTRNQIDAMRETLIEKHGDKCSICARPRTSFKNRLSVDHNHRTGNIRGLLCFYCNKRLVGRHSLQSAMAVYNYFRMFDPEGG